VVAGGALAGGVVGLIVGAAIGSKKTERWDSLQLPIRIGILPRIDANRVSIQVSNR